MSNVQFNVVVCTSTNTDFEIGLPGGAQSLALYCYNALIIINGVGSKAPDSVLIIEDIIEDPFLGTVSVFYLSPLILPTPRKINGIRLIHHDEIINKV